MKFFSDLKLKKHKALAAKKIQWGNLRKKDRTRGENNKIDVLKVIPIFSSLSKRQLTEVANLVYERHYHENEFIFQIDQPGAALFMIQSGEISVEIPTENGSAQLATLKAGSFLGEIALLDDSPRSATARALTHTTTLALSRNDLHSLIQTEPEIASHIYKSLASIIASRLKATNELLENEGESAA